MSAKQWYHVEKTDIFETFNTNPEHGLTQPEAQKRLAQHGPNELVERGGKSPWLILWEQMSSTMVVILIIAAVASAFLGDYKDAAAIMAIVVLNALLGFNQEYRAEKAMAALKKLAVPTVKVRRGGELEEIPAVALVPGDVVLLEAGNLVPADGRLFESANLRVQEAALTGESEPVEKHAQTLPQPNLALGDRRNMVYMGTTVTYGRGQVIITDTGMATELGNIATMLQTVSREQTPLQQRLDQLGKGLAAAALILVAIIFVLGLLRGESLELMFLTAVSMAVAAVPEGLPAVVTIALALGAQRMLKRNSLIRKLPAVETLGSVTVICSDKTGTLTENRMTVTVLDVAGNRLDLPAAAPQTEISAQQAFPLLLAGGALCNDATVKFAKDNPAQFHTVGDPTEGALVAVAHGQGLEKSLLDKTFSRVSELPFDSNRKRMTTVHKFPAAQTDLAPVLQSIWDWNGWLGTVNYIAFTKGAVDGMLSISDRIWVKDHIEPMDSAWQTRITQANNELAQNGMRVLGIACRQIQSEPDQSALNTLESGMIFVGMVGMIDPARPEVKSAVATCKSAGIRPVMITGDHPLTAGHIARTLGIADTNRIVTGQELEQLSEKELENIVEEVPIYARVSPEHKLKIVQALQNKGHIVAMTGDGVNDAPALKKADIGVAMGITGTDVSKEAADMVLQDDNFATIVAAVEEGRVIYDNIRKFIKFLLSSNSGELWVMLVAPFLGMPLPLLPLQILWMNLVTDGLPALTLGLEPPERGTMRRPPYPPNENIFARGMARDIILIGLVMGTVSLGTGYVFWQNAIPHWQTMVFTTLTLSQMALALTIRSEKDSLFSIGIFTNKYLLGAVFLTFILQLLVIYVPYLQNFFHTNALTLAELVLCLAMSTFVFIAVELKKWFTRQKT